MKNNELPTWLLALLGLSDYTPRGMAVRFAKSPNLAMVKRPTLASPKANSAPAPGASKPAPQAAVTDDAVNPQDVLVTTVVGGRRAA